MQPLRRKMIVNGMKAKKPMKAAMTAMERDLKRVWGRKKVEDLRSWKKLTGFWFFPAPVLCDV